MTSDTEAKLVAENAQLRLLLGAALEEHHCAECAYWKKQPPDGTWLADLVEQGVCGRIYEESYEKGEAAGTFNHWGDDSGLLTKPDFGCVLFVPKHP